MAGAPAIVWLRPGVGYVEAAAASMARLESAFNARYGRRRRCNSSYRDYGLQLSMYQAWTAWTEGRGPKPNHSRALHPDKSAHCLGLADDTDEWATPGYIALAADHGWIRTAAGDPTEQHHFEYQWWRDNHRTEGWPAGTGSMPFPNPQEDTLSREELDELKAHVTAEARHTRTVIEQTAQALPDRIFTYVIPSALPGENPSTLGKLIRAVVQDEFSQAQRNTIATGYEPGVRLLRYVRSDITGDFFALYDGGYMFRIKDQAQIEMLGHGVPNIKQVELWKLTEIAADGVDKHPGAFVRHEKSAQSGDVYAVSENNLGGLAARRLTGAEAAAVSDAAEVDRSNIWAYAPINYQLS